jgi:hypothetical protein
MGKAYANRKKVEDRPESDFYQTPRPLTWELLKLNEFDYGKTVLEPACGDLAIYNEIEGCFKDIIYFDKNRVNGILSNIDFLDLDPNRMKWDYIITNPPFSLFDEFVMKAKEIAREKFAFIGKTNFFGAYKRYKNGIWKHLKHVYVFNRQVDYRYFREDNKLICGNLITGWFIWDMNWNESWWKTSIIDVQKYVLNKQK